MIAVVCLVIGMAIPSFAADSGTITVDQTDLVTFDGLGNSSFQRPGLANSASGCLGLGPVDAASSEDAYITFKVTVDTAGTYTFKLWYASNTGTASDGSAQERKADVIVNDGARVSLATIANHSGWENYITVEFEAELNSGDNTVTFKNDANFDNDKIKAINIDSLEFALKAASGDAPTTDAPTTDAPTTDAPTTDAPTTGDPAEGDKAPATGFATIALAVVAFGSGAVVFSKRH